MHHATDEQVSTLPAAPSHPPAASPAPGDRAPAAWQEPGAENGPGHHADAGDRFILERHDRALRHLLAAMGGAFFDVIDVGGGLLSAAPLFAEYGHTVVAHADAPGALLRFPELARRFPERVSARIGPFHRLAAADGEFDLAISVGTIGYVDDWRGLLAELCRVSRRWVAIEFAAESGARRLARSVLARGRREAAPVPLVHEVPVASVEEELARHGLHPVAMERQFVLPIAVHRLLHDPVISDSMERALARAGVADYLGNPVMLLAERPRGPSRELMPFA